jgi:undecaprenyl-diphosphatase
MSRDAAPLTIGRAIALGLVHGPTELLPVSSSGHVGLVAGLLGWPYEELPPEARKAFEVALHVGTLPAMLVVVPAPGPVLAILATLPPALAGLLLEGPVERRLGGLRATSAGLVLGSALLVAADAVGGRDREDDAVGARDALAIGLAQAAALAPGLSRLGMAVAAARLRGFPRERAFELGRTTGLPVVAGASVLKAVRLAQRGLDPSLWGPFAAGAAAAAVSTLASRRLARSAPLRLCAAERVALAGAAVLVARRRR